MLAFATKGTGTNDEQRLQTLLTGQEALLLHYDKSKKINSFLSLLQQFRRHRRQLIVMEGTGIAGGMACLLARLLWGHRYVVSSGDAVGPFVATHVRLLGPLFACYERILCRWAAGFIGWTPYLVGRAMTFGTPRGVTAPGWVLGGNTSVSAEQRQTVRQQWGLEDQTIVFGLLGSLSWNSRREYCYGLELVRALKQTSRRDIAVVIVGEGSGRDRLAEEAGELLGRQVFLPGPVPLEQVVSTLAGFDVASLPQSTDAVGAFRYTTKICEYLMAGLPVLLPRIPMAYDLDLPEIFRLPGETPWDPPYVAAIAQLMTQLDKQQLDKNRNFNNNKEDLAVSSTFDRDSQVQRVQAFLKDLLEDLQLN